MNLAWVASSLSILAAAGMARGEIFTATSALHSAYILERDIMDIVKSYMHRTEDKLEKLKQFVSEYSEVENEVLNETDDDKLQEVITGNALHAFHLAKRFAVDWRNIDSQMRKDSWSVVAKKVDSRKLGETLPNESDLIGVAKSLLRLHHIYKMDLDKLASGELLGVPTAATLTARDCLYLGKQAYRLGQFASSVEWLETALKLAEQEGNSTLTREQIIPHAEAARAAHDAEASKANNTNVHVLSEPLNGRSPAEVRRSAELRHPPHYVIGVNTTNDQDYVNYGALCRGEQLLPSREAAKLKCYNSDRGHAYFKLRPVKVEQKHINPDLLLFHDVITDNEITAIKNVSARKLQRSRVSQIHPAVTDDRVSRTAWLEDEDHRVVAAVSRRAAAITGLHTSGQQAEQLQACRYPAGGHYSLHFDTKFAFRRVVNYGIGGHYNYHEDFLFKNFTQNFIDRTPEYMNKGDRIATFILYLDDVIRGGATAFPKLGVSVFPERGAAAFWYNLKANGRGDPSTLHGGCPVVYGTKWIANKWIRERSQFLRRPCKLDRKL